MQFNSTRSRDQQSTFCEVVLEGLCRDGGLAMPKVIPKITPAALADYRSLDYCALAQKIMGYYCDDIPAQDLAALLEHAYQSGGFSSKAIVTTTKLTDDAYILGLSNGPTFAFKDMAMQFLGALFPYILEKNDAYLNILGATSGDTGSSAIHAMRGKARINVFMLSPFERMSAFQTAQMYSVLDDNIHNIAIKGVFDDCQDLVKALNNDQAFKAQYHLGAVNSINWARILAQIVYYFKGYFLVTQNNDAPVDFVVPSGNFGNIFAGIVAREMGLPIRKLILATNENNVLDEFFKTGVYQPRAADAVHLTSSPSMDIAKASNFERFIYLIAGAEKTRELWQQIETQGYFDLRNDPLWAKRSDWGIESGSSSHQDRMNTIKAVQEQYKVMIDPHTADGLHVAQAYKTPGVKQVYLETAKPIKFAQAITEALGTPPEVPQSLADLESLPQRFEVMDADAQQLKAYLSAQIK